MPDDRRQTPARHPGALRIGSVAGTDVYVTSSWFLVAVLIAITFAPWVDSIEPGLGAFKYVAGLALAIVLYGSVLVHEAAHAYVARHYGYPVGAITLHFLGGATEIDGEATTPWHEFATAVVGPIASLVVGGVGLALLQLPVSGLSQAALQWLAGANLFVGAMNLIPGLPLDGGRVLKSIVWGVTGRPHKGTIAAAWGGRVTAVLVIAWPFVQPTLLGTRPDPFDYLIAFVIGLFLWQGASASLVVAHVRSALPDLVARQLARPTLAVPGDLPLAEAVRRAQEASAGAIITTATSGELVGLVSEAALLAVPPDRRPWMPVSSVARAIADGLRLPVTIHGEELLRAMQRTPSSEYVLVEQDGSVFGVLATADVDAAFRAAPH